MVMVGSYPARTCSYMIFLFPRVLSALVHYVIVAASEAATLFYDDFPHTSRRPSFYNTFYIVPIMDSMNQNVLAELDAAIAFMLACTG